MKKIMITLAAMLITGSIAFAQDYKPTQGTFTTEVNFNPLGGTNFSLPTYIAPTLGPAIAGIKGRYFLSDNLAVRALLTFGYESNNEHAFTNPGVTPEVEETTSNSMFSFGIAPGIEYHFGNWEKTSLYCGAEIGFGMSSSSTSVENAGLVSGSKIEVSGANYDILNDRLYNPSVTRFGINVFTGFDHYFTQNLFVGVELGLGFGTASTGELEVTEASVTTKFKDYSSSTSFGFYCNPAIRLGWKF